MLFAFSNIDAQKFEQVMQSFQGSAGILSGGVTLNKNDLIFEALPESNVTESTQQVEENLEILKETIEQYIELKELESEVSVEFDSRGLIIRFKDNALFDSGSARLKASSEEILLFIGELLKNEDFMDRAVRV
jgi:chemotaxis protein MotB